MRLLIFEMSDKLPTEDKRRIVECLVEKVVIGDGEIDITLSHRPPSEEVCKNQ
jgi:hypothetical protein